MSDRPMCHQEQRTVTKRYPSICPFSSPSATLPSPSFSPLFLSYPFCCCFNNGDIFFNTLCTNALEIFFGEFLSYVLLSKEFRIPNFLADFLESFAICSFFFAHSKTRLMEFTFYVPLASNDSFQNFYLLVCLSSFRFTQLVQIFDGNVFFRHFWISYGVSCCICGSYSDY